MRRGGEALEGDRLHIEVLEGGLRLCREVQPDLIIADVVMPGMDGLEMCRRVRALPELSIVPIILLTAKDDKETESGRAIII